MISRVGPDGRPWTYRRECPFQRSLKRYKAAVRSPTAVVPADADGRPWCHTCNAARVGECGCLPAPGVVASRPAPQPRWYPNGWSMPREDRGKAVRATLLGTKSDASGDDHGVWIQDWPPATRMAVGPPSLERPRMGPPVPDVPITLTGPCACPACGEDHAPSPPHCGRPRRARGAWCGRGQRVPEPWEAALATAAARTDGPYGRCPKCQAPLHHPDSDDAERHRIEPATGGYCKADEPLVAYWANRYARAAAEVAVTRDELMQAGRIATSRARAKFDPNRGVKFTTFAFPAIRREMRDMIRLEGRRRQREALACDQEMARDAGDGQRYHQVYDAEQAEPNPLDDAMKSVGQGVALGILDRMPPTEAWLLRSYYGVGLPRLTIKEIARVRSVGLDRVRADIKLAENVAHRIALMAAIRAS